MVKRLVLLTVAASFLGACSTVPAKFRADPAHLLERACSPGAGLSGAKGSVWMKAASREASGQFPADVDAQSGRTLRLEVTNLLGGIEALISVSPDRYDIEVPGKKDRKAVRQSGEGSWGGIPLIWAPDLFLGRIPCPTPEQLSTASRRVDESGALVLETRPSLQGAAERFEYRFRDHAGDRWPEGLVWERLGPLGHRVEFRFDDPEDLPQSPRKWEAKSSAGEVKVRWRDRTVLR